MAKALNYNQMISPFEFDEIYINDAEFVRKNIPKTEFIYTNPDDMYHPGMDDE